MRFAGSFNRFGRAQYALAKITRRAEWPPGTERIAVTGFIAEAPPGFEPTLNWEHDDLVWVDPSEIASYHTLGWLPRVYYSLEAIAHR